MNGLFFFCKVIDGDSIAHVGFAIVLRDHDQIHGLSHVVHVAAHNAMHSGHIYHNDPSFAESKSIPLGGSQRLLLYLPRVLKRSQWCARLQSSSVQAQAQRSIQSRSCWGSSCPSFCSSFHSSSSL